MKKENRGKKILFAILIVILIIIFLITGLSCEKDNKIFYENVYSYLTDNEYNDMDVERDFLEDKKLFDDNHVCDDIVFENGILKLYDCKIIEDEDTSYEDYCTYDGETYECTNGKSDDEVDTDSNNDIETEDESNMTDSSTTDSNSDDNNSQDLNTSTNTGNSNSSTNNNNNTTTNPTPDVEDVVANTQGVINFDLSESGITNNDVTVSVDGDENLKYCITSGDTCVPSENLTGDITLNTEGNNRVCVTKPGASNATVVCSEVVTIDKTIPVINDPIITGTLGTNGWYTSDVTIAPNGTTDNSDLESITIDKTEINDNTAGEIVTITAIDKAGNMAIKQLEIKIDKVDPVITNYEISGSEGLNDWYISDVAVSDLTATDDLSGLKDVVSNQTVFTAETVGTDVIITATDNAGNTSEVIVPIKIDKTEPIINDYDITEVKGLNDWYIENIMITNIDATDSFSGIEQSYLEDIEFTIDYETVGDQIEIQVVDRAGHTASEILNVKVDLNAPTPGEIILNGTASTSGWYTSDVTVETTAGSDNMSGVKETTVNLDILTGIQAETDVELTTTDNAGHESTVTETVKIDKIVPEVGEIIVNGTLGSNGWYTSNVTISKTDGFDHESGHMFTFVDLLAINNNTVGTTVNITTMDTAGHVSRATKVVKIDKQVPTITQNGDIKIEQGRNVDLSTKFTTTFGVSTGTTTCSISDTSSLSVGVHNLSCTATSLAGLSATINTTVEIVKTYEIVDYVESDGGQYINTGISNTGDYIFEDEFLITDYYKNNGSWLIGGRINTYYSLGIHISPQGIFNAYGGHTKYFSPNVIENQWYEMKFSRFELTIGGVNYPVMGQKLIPEAYETEIWLGGNKISYDGVSRDMRNFVGQRKSFKITDATTGKVLRDYIPVKLISTGEVGFWDLVEDKFYGNEGEGKFTSPV